MHLEGNLVSALSPFAGSHGIPQLVVGKDLSFYGKTGCFGSKTQKTNWVFQIPMEVQVWKSLLFLIAWNQDCYCECSWPFGLKFVSRTLIVLLSCLFLFSCRSPSRSRSPVPSPARRSVSRSQSHSPEVWESAIIDHLLECVKSSLFLWLTWVRGGL